MRRLRLLVPALLLAAAAATLVPGGTADHPAEWSGPPEGAAAADAGPLEFAAWPSPRENLSLDDTLAPGGNGTLRVTWRDRPGGGNATYNASVAANASANATLVRPRTFETGNVTGDDTAGPWDHPRALPFSVAADAARAVTFDVVVDVYEARSGNATGNGTANVTWVHVGSATLQPSVQVKAPPAPPTEGPPVLLIAGLAVGGAAVAGGGYLLYRRRTRVPQGPRRSQALQELEAEESGGEEVQQVQEQRAEERKSRELQILEAKADDHRESIERARQRYEEGELTEHQFERIKERKEEALEDVLDEIEEKKGELGD